VVLTRYSVDTVVSDRIVQAGMFLLIICFQRIVHSLSKVNIYDLNAVCVCVYMPVFSQILYQLNDFHDILYEIHVIGGHLRHVLFNFISNKMADVLKYEVREAN
jgi:hypothetical protein